MSRARRIAQGHFTRMTGWEIDGGNKMPRYIFCFPLLRVDVVLQVSATGALCTHPAPIDIVI